MTSDHVPINLSSSMNLENLTKKPKMVYNYNKAYWGLFKQSLPNNAPTDILNDVKLLNKFICESLLQAAECSIPKKDLYNSKKILPSYILELIKQGKFIGKNTKKKN